MADQSRLFQAGPDPFGRTWKVQFRWLQTGITIRHADTVDVKFFVTPDGGETEEKVIALPHPALLSVCEKHGRRLSDPLCMEIAAAHLKYMIETSEDMDKTLVTLRPEEIAAYDQKLHNVTVAHRG
jgi:hypothetical protein